MTEEQNKERKRKQREYMRVRRANRPEPTPEEKIKINEERRKYYNNNKERILAIRKKPKAVETDRTWRIANKEKRNEQMREYRREKSMDPEFKSEEQKSKRREISRRHLSRARSWYTTYRKTLYCVRCGYNNWRALEFHHKDPSTKLEAVNKLARMSRSPKNKQRLLDEIAKCEVICANCHKIEHNHKTLIDEFDIRLEYRVNNASSF